MIFVLNNPSWVSSRKICHNFKFWTHCFPCYLIKVKDWRERNPQFVSVLCFLFCASANAAEHLLVPCACKEDQADCSSLMAFIVRNAWSVCMESVPYDVCELQCLVLRVWACLDSWSVSLVLSSSLWAHISRCAFSLVWVSDHKFVCVFGMTLRLYSLLFVPTLLCFCPTVLSL